MNNGKKILQCQATENEGFAKIEINFYQVARKSGRNGKIIFPPHLLISREAALFSDIKSSSFLCRLNGGVLRFLVQHKYYAVYILSAQVETGSSYLIIINDYKHCYVWNIIRYLYIFCLYHQVCFSQVAAHAELAWILSCLCTIPRLQRMLQWKVRPLSSSPCGMYTVVSQYMCFQFGFY